MQCYLRISSHFLQIRIRQVHSAALEFSTFGFQGGRRVCHDSHPRHPRSLASPRPATPVGSARLRCPRGRCAALRLERCRGAGPESRQRRRVARSCPPHLPHTGSCAQLVCARCAALCVGVGVSLGSTIADLWPASPPPRSSLTASRCPCAFCVGVVFISAATAQRSRVRQRLRHAKRLRPAQAFGGIALCSDSDSALLHSRPIAGVPGGPCAAAAGRARRDRVPKLSRAI